MSMTLLEALQTPEVKGQLNTLIESAIATGLTEALEDALPDAVEAEIEKRLPGIRESVREEIRKDGELRELHDEAVRIIEASPLKGAAKTNLLDDYALDLKDGQPKPGRGLALIEAVADADGKVTKPALTVLKETVDEDIKRSRNVIKEAAPTIPVAPGGTESSTATAATFGGAGSKWAERLRQKGLDPEKYGATPKPPDPAPAT